VGNSTNRLIVLETAEAAVDSQGNPENVSNALEPIDQVDAHVIKPTSTVACELGATEILGKVTHYSPPHLKMAMATMISTGIAEPIMPQIPARMLNSFANSAFLSFSSFTSAFNVFMSSAWPSSVRAA
jgi:hypothetical protein